MALESIRINALEGRRIGGRRALKWPETLMHHFLQIRFTLRQARKSPGFALTTILTLAVGIGATTGIFSLVNAILLRPIPFPQADRLMSLQHESHSSGNVTQNSLSYPDFFDWRTQNRSFSAMASYRGDGHILTTMGPAETLYGETVSSDFFRVLAIHPALGRDLIPEDEKPGQHVVMLSHQLWQSSFGSRPDIIGQAIALDNESYIVVGVMPESFSFPIENPAPQLWVSLAADAVDPDGSAPPTQSRGNHLLLVIGRLKTGVRPEQARADLSRINANLARQYPDSNKHFTSAHVETELESLVGDTRPALRILFAAVGLLLMIACANVAGLLLSRASKRQPEIALRVALGARRSEIIRQVLVESIVLSLLGGTLGLGLSTLLLRSLVLFLPHNLPRLDTLSIDPTVMVFAILVSILCGLLFGVLPAWWMSRLGPSLGLRYGARGITRGRGQNRAHSILVVAETALGLLLLIGASLFIRSFVRVLAVDPGFDRHNTLIAGINYPEGKGFANRVNRFYDQWIPQVAALAGVQSAAAGWPLPFASGGMGVSFEIEGHPRAKGETPSARAAVVTPNFFNTLRIPIVRGRDFAPTDSGDAPFVVIVNQTFARKFFPGEDPIGKHINPGLDDGLHPQAMRQIIAIVGDVKMNSLTTDAPAAYYLPLTQAGITAPTLVIRTAGDPIQLIAPLRMQLGSINRDIPLYEIHTYEDRLSNAVSQPRFQTLLLTSFAVLALLLSATGLYAVLSYMVVQRANEIGLRMALGARREDVLALILKRGLRLTGSGLTMGLAASALLTRYIATLLYGVHLFDPVIYIGVSVLMALIALAATMVPAMQASRVDPIKTLREQ
jgi:putative ABC transport system permease protein